MSRGRRSTPFVYVSGGLTLTEVAVVLGICGVLAAIILPTHLWAREKARGTQCCENLRALGQAYTVALDDANGYVQDAFYSFEGGSGLYLVFLKSHGDIHPDPVIKDYSPTGLSCPSDISPSQVLGYTAGEPDTVPTGYAYNVTLPLLDLLQPLWHKTGAS